MIDKYDDVIQEWHVVCPVCKEQKEWANYDNVQGSIFHGTKGNVVCGKCNSILMLSHACSAYAEGLHLGRKELEDKILDTFGIERLDDDNS